MSLITQTQVMAIHKMSKTKETYTGMDELSGEGDLVGTSMQAVFSMRQKEKSIYDCSESSHEQ